MQVADIPANEDERLQALRSLNILDTNPEERYDRIINLASRFFDVPIAYVAMVDANRQWFKAKCGLSTDETGRDISFCSHTILEPDTLVIPDATLDDRFHDNPLVTGDPHIRFYAGQPIAAPGGYNVGTLCIADHSAREFSDPDIEMLRELGALVEREISLLDVIELQEKLLEAADENERLLLNILPRPIARRLQCGEENIADYFADTTVIFADLVNFTAIAQGTDATEIVSMLNDLFSDFDALSKEYGVEKIKTIGDAYMAVAGIPEPNEHHAQAAVSYAEAMLQAVARFNMTHDVQFKVRIGLNSGPVVAGVIGTHKFIYDLWGDTVNVAARMESHGVPNRIHLSSATFALLRESHAMEERGTIEVKGKGSMLTYLLTPNLVSV